jgi:uncharacterized integral membrane protein
LSFIRSIPFIIITLVFVAFIVANRHDVMVSFAPMDYSTNLPLYIVLFAGIFIGFLFAGWVGVIKRLQGAMERHGLKKESGRLKQQVENLEGELDKSINTGVGDEEVEDLEAPQSEEKKA